MPYGDDVDIGRAILGTSTVGAVVLAVGFGFAVAPVRGLTTNVISGGACATFPHGSHAPSAWFLVALQNDSDFEVHVRDVEPQELSDVTLERFAIAPHPDERTSGLIVTDDTGRPTEYGRTVPVDSGFVVPAHGELDVTGRIVLRPGAVAGQVRGFTVTTAGVLGTLRTDSTPEAFGVGVEQGGDEPDVDCLRD